MKFVRKRGNNHHNVSAFTEQYDLSMKETEQLDECEPWEFTEDFYPPVNEYYTNDEDENVTVYAKTDDCGSNDAMEILDHLMSEESDGANDDK